MHSALDMQQGSIRSCPAAVTVLYADLCHVSSAEESSAQSRCQPGTQPPCLGLACGWCDGVCSSHRALPCTALMGVPAAKPARGVRATAGSAQRGVGDCHFLQQQPRGCCTSTASPTQYHQSCPAPPVLPSTARAGVLLPRPSASSPGTSAAWGWPWCQLVPVQAAQPLRAESKHASMSNIIYL